MYKYSQYIAIYKRYPGTDIFENADLALKNVIPFTMSAGYDWRTGIAPNQMYGDLSNNVFIDVAKEIYISEWDEKLQKALELGEINIDNKINEIKNNVTNDKENGYVIQGYYFPRYYDSYYRDYETQKYLIPHIRIICEWNVTKLPIKEYRNLTHHLAWLNALPYGGTGSPRFYDYHSNQLGGSTQMENFTIYFDMEGNFLGTDISVVFDEVMNSYDPS